ncbi:MAG: hypothetical protein HYY51_01210, partial [Candidatus Magasanikbacteria bacterium]|nr:hypothetical protein [Candidatus Magasanikbacteria bacterium]
DAKAPEVKKPETPKAPDAKAPEPPKPDDPLDGWGGDPPPLDDGDGTGGFRAPRRSRWPWAAALAALVAIGLVWALWPESNKKTPPDTAAATTPNPPVPTPDPVVDPTPSTPTAVVDQVARDKGIDNAGRIGALEHSSASHETRIGKLETSTGTGPVVIATDPNCPYLGGVEECVGTLVGRYRNRPSGQRMIASGSTSVEKVTASFRAECEQVCTATPRPPIDSSPVPPGGPTH